MVEKSYGLGGQGEMDFDRCRSHSRADMLGERVDDEEGGFLGSIDEEEDIGLVYEVKVPVSKTWGSLTCSSRE